MPTADDRPRVVELLPDLAAELVKALTEAGELELASQVNSLRIVELCGCDDDFCASFYTGPKPDGGWGSNNKNVVPPIETGMVVLDVVDGIIRYVEIIDRDDVQSAILPEDPAGRPE